MNSSQSKKIVILGHFGVGKTSLVRRFVDSMFSEDYLVTLGVQVKKKVVTIDDAKVTLIIWDIEGNSSISKARKSYLTGTHGFLYVFDVTRPETFENLEDEMDFLANNFPSIPVCKIGNKSDLLLTENAKEFFEQEQYKDCDFTSAKEGNNVENVFQKITKQML
ncbi:Rab family GTPase [Ulvibacter antarcticus]|uniref:Small GTP-binding protein n=1 Tax=Ulvibacter antarcticus TaxID=442714 RepID=A0A3L9Z024_9FLAO|nr:Rab family GTPase [Ulvibacter antarcticus]RMA66183.1 small GTP-binding protein [Ulvibacter antarcticus]